jgi:hypothetical protein
MQVSFVRTLDSYTRENCWTGFCGGAISWLAEFDAKLFEYSHHLPRGNVLFITLATRRSNALSGDDMGRTCVL